MQTAKSRHVKILALDAGGVKCLSSLLLLEELMKGLSSSGVIEKPCHHFQLICGSQWGGVLAIMLGRLKMSIEECKIWIGKLSWDGTNVLRRYVPLHGKINSEYFESKFKSLINSFKRYKGKQDMSFYDPNDHFDSACKTAVLAFDIHGNIAPTLFRSYFASTETYQCEIPIWKVALASISNPYTMAPVSLKYTEAAEEKEFIDASIVGYSNPSRQAMSEGKLCFGERSIKALINIGTGDRARTTTPSQLHSCIPTRVHLALVRLYESVATDPKRVAGEVEGYGIEGWLYYRMTVESGLNAVHSMNFSQKSRRTVLSQTEGYLKDSERIKKIRGWSNHLKDASLITVDCRIADDDVSVQIQRHPQQIDLFDTRTEKPIAVEHATQSWLKDFRIFVKPLFPRTWSEENTRIKIAILDTGIDATHQYIQPVRQGKPKYYKFRDFTISQSDTDAGVPTDICGHGTHIAGIFLEFAPHAELYIARVFKDREIGGNEARNVAAAIEYANKIWQVNIISMSFGFDSEHEGMEKAIKAAYKENIVMLAAASNSGNRPFQPIAFPARNPFVICVNSADGDGNKSSFNPPAPNGLGKTCREDNFSILGQSINSCWPDNIKAAGVTQIDGKVGTWRTSSGSSVATAVAASTAALIMEIGDRHSGLIDEHSKLKTYRGIQQVFNLMSGEDEIQGFKNIRPWNVLRGRHPESPETAHNISVATKNP